MSHTLAETNHPATANKISPPLACTPLFQRSDVALARRVSPPRRAGRSLRLALPNPSLAKDPRINLWDWTNGPVRNNGSQHPPIDCRRTGWPRWRWRKRASARLECATCDFEANMFSWLSGISEKLEQAQVVSACGRQRPSDKRGIAGKSRPLAPSQYFALALPGGVANLPA